MATHQQHQPPNLPYTTIHKTTPLTPNSAHDFLRAYLDRANTDAALQPDASITEHGPTSRTTTAAPNLALHNLKRVQAGLAGELLGRDLAIGDDGNLKVDGGGELEGEAEGWEDKAKYEQGEGDGKAAEVGDGDGREMEEDLGLEEGELDKEERKRKKKERRLAERRAKSGA